MSSYRITEARMLRFRHFLTQKALAHELGQRE
jgi:hypothetical protein